MNSSWPKTMSFYNIKTTKGVLDYEKFDVWSEGAAAGFGIAAVESKFDESSQKGREKSRIIKCSLKFLK